MGSEMCIRDRSLSEVEKETIGLNTLLDLNVFNSHCECVQKIKNGDEVSLLSLKKACAYFDIIKRESLSEDSIKKIEQFIDNLEEAIKKLSRSEHSPPGLAD